MIRAIRAFLQTGLCWADPQFFWCFMRRLPSLNGLKAFEATARTGSFAEAAAELHVSPAAVSRMVRLLEESLGVVFFQRRPNGLTVTPAGRAYQVGLTPILDSIAGLTLQVSAMGRPRVLTVGAGPTFAIRWLIPRLSAFRSEHPKIEVRITTGGAAAPFAEDWTCGIKLGDGFWDGFAAEALFPADLTPVCAPRLARRIAEGGLEPESLIRVAHSPEDWPRWMQAAGLPR